MSDSAKASRIMRFITGRGMSGLKIKVVRRLPDYCFRKRCVAEEQDMNCPLQVFLWLKLRHNVRTE